MVQFQTEETNKGEDDAITWGEPYVEALRERLSFKTKLWNGENYVTYCKFWICESDLLYYKAIKLVTYKVFMCLNRSCAQCVYEKYKKSNSHCNYQLNTKSKL